MCYAGFHVCDYFHKKDPSKATFLESHFNFMEILLRHGRSPVNLLHIFRTPFPKNTSGWLL